MHRVIPRFGGFLGLVSVAGCFYGFRRGEEILLDGFRRWSLFVVSVVEGNICCMVSVVVLFMVSGCCRTAAVSPMEAVRKHQDVSKTN